MHTSFAYALFSVSQMFIIFAAGEVLEGVYVTPQNKEESRKNVEQVLQFISSRHIRMPHISSRGKSLRNLCYFSFFSIMLRTDAPTFSYVRFLSADIVDGNLKSVMRIILALAAHFKPSASHRAANGSGRSSTKGYATHNPLSAIALAQGAAAALASARFDASQPTRVTRMHR